MTTDLPFLIDQDHAALERLATVSIENPQLAFVTLAQAAGRDLASDYRAADLRGFALNGQDLRPVVLEGADLRGADLRGTRMRVTDRRKALREGALTGKDARAPADPIAVWIHRWRVLRDLGDSQAIAQEARELLARGSTGPALYQEDLAEITNWLEPAPANRASPRRRSIKPQKGPAGLIELSMPQGWADLFNRHNLPQLERDVIPGFLPHQRWFAAKNQRVQAGWLFAHGEIAAPPEGAESRPASFLAGIVEAVLAGDGRHRYFLPLAAEWSPSGSEQRQALLAATLAELRQSRREGALVDAIAQDDFVMAMGEAIQREASLPLKDAADKLLGEMRFRHTPVFDQLSAPDRLVVRRIGNELSNSSVLFEDYAVLKFYRRLQPGPHPEIEMGRFLVERAGFANTPPVLATLEVSLPGDAGPETSALGVLFGFVRNHGDGWSLALDYLLRYLDNALNEAALNEAAPGATPPGRPAELPDPDHFFLALARQLGLRTAQMHRALAECARDDPDFAPEPITPADLAQWRGELQDSAEEMLARLERGRTDMPEEVRDLAERVLGQGRHLFDGIQRLAPNEIDAVKTRFHGDLHLGQVIAVENDFFFIDFEGEPGRPLPARRRKSTPLRDVAGMIRSFHYAATAAARQFAETRPAAAPRLTALADAWGQRAVDGFRAAYHKAMRGCRAYPANKLQARALIDFFTLEKAIYEVSYELANRPEWVASPLNAILRVLEKMPREKIRKTEHDP